MKRFFSVLILIIIAGAAQAQNIPHTKDNAFDVGEVLKYKLRYGFITAAEATMSVMDTEVTYDDRPVYHLVAQGKTAGTFNVFYKVRNRYDSYIDKKTLLPHFYAEDIKEGGYTRQESARFYQGEKKVIAKKGTFKSDDNQLFDLVSSYYFARSIDMSKMKIGDKFTLKYFLADGVYPLEIQYMGKEVVKSKIGKISCLKFSPSIQPGRIFRKDSRLYLWITDDGNRIPVKAQVEILVGSVTLELTDATGLKYPIAKMD